MVDYHQLPAGHVGGAAGIVCQDAGIYPAGLTLTLAVKKPYNVKKPLNFTISLQFPDDSPLTQCHSKRGPEDADDKWLANSGASC
jgi:hypothetical protein